MTFISSTGQDEFNIDGQDDQDENAGHFRRHCLVLSSLRMAEIADCAPAGVGDFPAEGLATRPRESGKLLLRTIPNMLSILLAKTPASSRRKTLSRSATESPWLDASIT